MLVPFSLQLEISCCLRIVCARQILFCYARGRILGATSIGGALVEYQLRLWPPTTLLEAQADWVYPVGKIQDNTAPLAQAATAQGEDLFAARSRS